MLNDSKKRYETIFLLVASGMLLLWLFLMASGDSTQMQLFIEQCNLFLSDFTNVIIYSADRNPYGSDLNGAGEHAYFPLSYLITYCFAPFSNAEVGHTMWKNPQLMICILIFFCFSSSVLFVQLYEMKDGNKAVRFGTASLMLLSGVYMFSLERGNLILISVIMTIYFLTGYQSKNRFIKETAFLALAVSASLKFSPALLGLLLIYEKRLKDAIKLMIYGILVCFLPFLFFQGGFSDIPIFFENVGQNMLKYRHSNFGLDKLLAYYPPVVQTLGELLNKITALLLLIAVPFQRKWKSLLSLILVMIMLPTHSELYNLLFLFPVFILFLNESKHESADRLYFICFLFLFCPLTIHGYNVLEYICYPMILMYLFLGTQSAEYLVTHRKKAVAFYRSFLPHQLFRKEVNS